MSIVWVKGVTWRMIAPLLVHPVVLTVAVVLFFFVTKWTLEGVFFHKDLAFITIPLENLYRRIQLSGASPLWAPELAGGYPLLATGQLGYWYPLHIFLRSFLPGVWVLNLSLLLHALLGGVGMVALLLHNRLRPFAAGIGAILFALGTNMVGKYESLNVILPFMWVPLILLFLQCYMETGKAKYLLLWIGVHTFSILVGHPQMAVYILLFSGIFVVTMTAFDWSRWPKAIVTLFGVGLIVGITSFYWLPILHVLEDTDRAKGTLKPNEQGMFYNQYSPEAFLGLIIPHPFGHHESYVGPPAENSLSSYYGPGALLVAAIGLLFRRQFPRFRILALVFIMSGLALATGGYSPLFVWMVEHGWTYFNFPSRFFFYTHVGIAFLAAAGVQVLVNLFNSPFTKAILALIVLGPVLWVSWSWHDGVPWQYTTEPAFVPLLQRDSSYQGTPRVLAGAALEGRVPHGNFDVRPWNPICDKCRYRQHFTSPFPKIDGVAFKVAKQSDSVGTMFVHLYNTEGKLLRRAEISHEQVISDEWNTATFERVDDVMNQELYVEFASDIEAKKAPRLLIHRNPADQYDPTGRLYNCTSGECEAVLDADASFRLVVDTPQVMYHDAMAPYIPAGYGLVSTQWGPSSLPILAVKEFMDPFDTWGDSFRDGYRTMMNRFGTSHLIGVFPAHRGLTTDGFTLLSAIPYQDQYLHLYQNNQAFPRLHFAEQVEAVASSADQINILMKADATDQRMVLADIPEDLLFTVGGNSAQIVHDDRTRVEIRTEQQEDGFLVLRDTFLKDWEARVNGESTRIYRVDGIFRGIFVPAGNHRVTFSYRPTWIKPALLVSGLSLLLFLFLGFWNVGPSLIPRFSRRIFLFNR